jgi:RimJ/RimL family protein N-acetyltransferase
MTAAPRLETDRLVLRAHSRDDFEASAAMWGDAAVARFIGGVPSTREASWSRLMRYFGMWPLAGCGYWVVALKDGGFIGEVGLADFQRALDPHPGRMPEAGWAFAPQFHGKGYAAEAVAAALAWGEANLGRKSFCMIDPANAPSIAVAQRVGFDAGHEASYAGKPTRVFLRGA